MGNDYDARRRNKKLNKRAAQDAADADGKSKRQRTKGRPTVRRLCRGACFNDPALTTEDAQWRESDDEAAAAWSAPAPDLLQPTAAEAANGQKAMRFSTAADPSAVVASAAAAKRKQRKEHESRIAAASAAADTAGTAAAAATGKGLPEKASQNSTPVPEALAALPPTLGRFMASQGFTAPTAIQAKVWGAALPKRRDVLAVAQPGAGKTLAYLLTMAARLMGAPAVGSRVAAGSDTAAAVGNDAAAGGGSQGAAAGDRSQGAEAAAEGPPAPQGLVLVPTRELAQQVAGVARKLRPATNFRTAVVTGGAERAPQVAALQKRPQLLVATPGRLLDLLDAGALTLGGVTAVALDEADKMLSLGFAPQLQRLHALLLPAQRSGGKSSSKVRRPQVLLCTATMPEAVAAAAAAWLRKPADCRVELGAGASAISPTVTQVVQVCAEHKKPRKLLKHLDSVRAAAKSARHPPRCLIFANKVKTVQFLGRLLAEHGHKAALLHGKRPQAEREEAMRDFRSGKVSTLVATDIAGRGLHISSLPLVVNYDFPGNLETYVHRVGRTGRLAADGHALSFLTRNLAPLAAPLLQLLQEHDQSIDPNLARLAAAYEEAVARAGPDALAAAAEDGGSSEDEEAALACEAAAAAGGGGGGVQQAEDIFEGLDAILSGGPVASTSAAGAAAAPGGSGHGGEFDAGAGRQGRRQLHQGSRKQQGTAPQLSQHRDFAKHAANLPPEALVAGAAVSRGVSRRPIGAASNGSRKAAKPAARTAHTAAQNGPPISTSGKAAAAPPADHSRIVTASEAAAPSDAAAARRATGNLAAELEAAIGSHKRGDLYEGEGDDAADGAVADGGGGGCGGGEGKNRKRSGAIGGRLRKKLARQRAADRAQKHSAKHSN